MGPFRNPTVGGAALSPASPLRAARPARRTGDAAVAAVRGVRKRIYASGSTSEKTGRADALPVRARLARRAPVAARAAVVLIEPEVRAHAPAHLTRRTISVVVVVIVVARLQRGLTTTSEDKPNEPRRGEPPKESVHGPRVCHRARERTRRLGPGLPYGNARLTAAPTRLRIVRLLQR